MSANLPRVPRPSFERPSADELRGRARSGASARRSGLVLAALPVAQCTLAAPLAWVLATHVVGHQQAFFAPIAALISLGVGLGQRRRRALELTLGVAVGIGVANLLINALGTGFLSIALVVALAMVGAILLAGPDSPLLVTQAAVAAVLVATIQPPTDGPDFSRFIDALIGGGVGLAVTFGLPADPIKALRRATRPLLAELAGALRDAGAALDSGDERAADQALGRARGIDDEHHEAIAVARDMARLAPARRGTRPEVERYARAAVHLDRATRNARVLARGVVRANGAAAEPPGGGEALRTLGDAVDAVRDELERGAGAARVQESAEAAVRIATGRFGGTSDFAAAVLLGQIRSIAVDLLRAAGMEVDDARALVREAGASATPPPVAEGR